MRFARLLQFLLLVLVATNSRTLWAQAAITTIWQPDRNKSIAVSADQIIVDDARKVAILRGNVLLIQDEVHLRCSRALLMYRSPAPNRWGAVDWIECQR